MTDCKQCFHCKATIPLQYPKYPPRGTRGWGRINLLHARLMYHQAKIRCTEGYWEKMDGTQMVYENLKRFTETVRVSNKHPRCPDYEV